MHSLEGKVALVTGASRGIGRAIAIRLAKEGALVGVHFARNQAAANETIHEIEAAGHQAFAVQADFRKLNTIDRFIEELDSKLMQITGDTHVDILVNNAGIAHMGFIETVTEENYDEVMTVNLKYPFFLVQKMIGRLRDGGRIINISSLAADRIFPGTIIYNLSKSALNTLTKNLAKQLGSHGITVNALMPGAVATEMNAGMLKNPQAKKPAEQTSVFSRIGDVDDIADIAAFFASPLSRWVTGQIVDASGGGLL